MEQDGQGRLTGVIASEKGEVYKTRDFGRQLRESRRPCKGLQAEKGQISLTLTSKSESSFVRDVRNHLQEYTVPQ
jgi:hypothetical protein